MTSMKLYGKGLLLTVQRILTEAFAPREPRRN
jgi:hypothetical protein